MESSGVDVDQNMNSFLNRQIETFKVGNFLQLFSVRIQFREMFYIVYTPAYISNVSQHITADV